MMVALFTHLYFTDLHIVQAVYFGQPWSYVRYKGLFNAYPIHQVTKRMNNI